MEVNGLYNPTTGDWFITYNGDAGEWIANTSGPAWLVGSGSENRASFSGKVFHVGKYGCIEFIDNFGSHKTMNINSQTADRGRIAHHFLLRNSELMGTNSADDSGGFSINGNTDEGGAGEDIIFYNNEVHHFGLTDPDGSDPDYIAVFISNNCHRIWVLDNRLHDMSGSALQVTANTASVFTTSYVYAGRNEAYNLWGTGMSAKGAEYIVYSENHIYNIKDNGGVSPSKGLAGQYAATDQWFLFNRIHDTAHGIMRVSGNVGFEEKLYAIGNVIYDIYPLDADGFTAGGYGEGAICLWGANNNYIIGNTMYNVPQGIITPAVTLFYNENNIISNLNEVNGYHILGSASTASYDPRINNNLFYQDGTIKVQLPGEPLMNVTTLNASTYGEGNLEGDPLFNDIGNIDFSISTSSPARDSGLASTALQVDVYDRFFDTFGVSIEKDLNDESRPQGSAWDIGAYEYMDTGPDIIHPNITSIASSTTDTTATITWTTNELATSTLNFGTTTVYGTASSSSISKTSHSFILSNLATSTTYHFQLSSWDAVGNLATSGDYTFTTTYTPPAPETPVTPAVITVTSHSGGGSGGGGRGTSLSVNTNGMSTTTLIVELKKQLLVLLQQLLLTLIEELKLMQAV